MNPAPTITGHDLLSGLPGEAMIRKGLSDRCDGCLSIESCLVEIASPRLARAGILHRDAPVMEAELTLYRLLSESAGDAFSRYNSLLRELSSFEHALDHRLSKAKAF
ncbi:MAG: hypothetical protein D4R65_10470 [Verrucomicrobiaceae bacterium]|nr:MAG: hypothetical protein D4R65_10470 [Verrucomicrobiaceae bacterium]